MFTESTSKRIKYHLVMFESQSLDHFTIIIIFINLYLNTFCHVYVTDKVYIFFNKQSSLGTEQHDQKCLSNIA